MIFSDDDIENATIFQYKLIDGSTIIAEEVDYDFENEIIFVINPIEVCSDGKKYTLKNYMVLEPSQPVSLRDDKIIASSTASLRLRHNYFQFNIMHALQNSLKNDDFDAIVDLLFPPVDSTNDKKNEENDFDFTKPFKVKKIKDDEKGNPWNRY